MQLLIFPGCHSPELTHTFMQALLKKITPENLWILPTVARGDGLSWQHAERLPSFSQPLQIIAFSAGVVAAYPLALAWQSMGGSSRLIAIDGWGMPLLGNLTVYRMSHDRWTHDTTYLPSPVESQGYFYADPAVDHLTMWASPQGVKGMGTTAMGIHPLTALDFIAAALTTQE